MALKGSDLPRRLVLRRGEVMRRNLDPLVLAVALSFGFAIARLHRINCKAASPLLIGTPKSVGIIALFTR